MRSSRWKILVFSDTLYLQLNPSPPRALIGPTAMAQPSLVGHQPRSPRVSAPAVGGQVGAEEPSLAKRGAGGQTAARLIAPSERPPTPDRHTAGMY